MRGLGPMTQKRIDEHNAAYEQAKAEAKCTCGGFYVHSINCQRHTSNILLRAEQIRRERARKVEL